MKKIVIALAALILIGGAVLLFVNNQHTQIEAACQRFDQAAEELRALGIDVPQETVNERKDSLRSFLSMNTLFRQERQTLEELKKEDMEATVGKRAYQLLASLGEGETETEPLDDYPDIGVIVNWTPTSDVVLPFSHLLQTKYIYPELYQGVCCMVPGLAVDDIYCEELPDEEYSFLMMPWYNASFTANGQMVSVSIAYSVSVVDAVDKLNDMLSQLGYPDRLHLISDQQFDEFARFDDHLLLMYCPQQQADALNALMQQ